MSSASTRNGPRAPARIQAHQENFSPSANSSPSSSASSPRYGERPEHGRANGFNQNNQHRSHHHQHHHHHQSRHPPAHRERDLPPHAASTSSSSTPPSSTTGSTHKVTFSNPPATTSTSSRSPSSASLLTPTTSATAGTVSPSPSASSASSSSTASSSGVPLSKWQKLFSAFKKNKSSPNLTNAAEAYRLKHSHNCSNSFLRAGISNMKGYKKANQDRCTAFSYLEGDPELAYFAIYDGHGGTGVANYLKDHLHEFILDQPEYQDGQMEEAIVKAFLQVDNELRTYGSATELTGSTATAILIKHGDLYCANLGDTRAVACVMGLVKALSSDHNTGNPKERERVYAMGGTIKDNRVGGVLIPTRSFGDFLLKSEHEKPAWKQVISPVPQIQSFKLDQHWEFVVVGSDGVWDAMSNQEMITFIKNQLSDCTTVAQRDKFVLSELCEQILDMCCAKTVSHYGKNSCDNMTIIIIWFDHGDRSETGSSVVSSCVSR